MMTQSNETDATTELSDLQEIAYSQEGRALLNQLHIMLRTARLYDPDNRNFRLRADETAELLRSCYEQFGELSLQVRAGYIYFCGIRIRENLADFAAAKHLKELFSQLDISGLLLSGPLSSRQVATVFQLLVRLTGSSPEGESDLETCLRSAGIEELEPLPPFEEEQIDEDTQRRKRIFARKTFFYMVDNLKLVSRRVGEDRPPNLAKTQRVIHAIVDQIVSEDAYLLELTALKSHDEYTYLHSANVCIYAVAMGARLGLSKSCLSDLGFAALFHDIGKCRLPSELLNKLSSFTESEWVLVRQHPVDGVLTISSALPFDRTSCRAMLAACEHHLNLDGSGYPRFQRGRELNLFSKIVTICDVFDAISSGRVYHKEPFSPEKSLEMMTAQTGSKFDPLLFKLFVNVVSVYPPGTLLLLDSGELAVTTARNSEDLFRPKAMLIGDSQGLRDEGIRINLMERDTTTGKYTRSIVRSIPPSSIEVDLTGYLLRDSQEQ